MPLACIWSAVTGRDGKASPPVLSMCQWSDREIWKQFDWMSATTGGGVGCPRKEGNSGVRRELGYWILAGDCETEERSPTPLILACRSGRAIPSFFIFAIKV